MKVNYRIFKEKSLMVQKYYGDWSNHDFEAAIIKFTNDPDWKHVEKIITDLRDAGPENAMVNIDTIVDIRNKYIKKEFLNVLLVDKPLPTALVHLFIKELEQKSNYTYCSSIDHVKEKLDLKESIEEIEFFLNNISCYSTV